MKRISLLLLFVLAAHSGMAQQSTPSAVQLPFRRSASAGIGISSLFNEKRNGGSKGFIEVVPNTVSWLSVNVYKSLGFTAGFRRGSYLASALPEDYRSGSFSLSNSAYNKEYDQYYTAYLLLHYEFYFPLGRPSSHQLGILLRPAVGCAYNRVDEAQFVPHVSTSSSGMGLDIYDEPSHDVARHDSRIVGMGTELGSFLYLPVTPKMLLWIGPDFWTMPAPHKRMYGLDVQLGSTFSFR